MKIKIKYLSIFFFFLSIIIFSSCKSNSFPILGQNKVFQNNLYKEYLNLGNGYYEIERYNEAIKFYEKVLEDKELGKTAYYKIAKCYGHLSDWSHALPMYEKMLSEDPENQSLKASIAYINSMVGDTDKALLLYKELLGIQPSNITYLENYLAIILSDIEIFKENRVTFEEIFKSLKENYPKNKNIEVFQNKFDELVEKLSEESDNKTDKSSGDEPEEKSDDKTEEKSDDKFEENHLDKS